MKDRVQVHKKCKRNSFQNAAFNRLRYGAWKLKQRKKKEREEELQRLKEAPKEVQP